jgi:hypothetical protein
VYANDIENIFLTNKSRKLPKSWGKDDHPSSGEL